jgi:hypothetical protein
VSETTTACMPVFPLVVLQNPFLWHGCTLGVSSSYPICGELPNRPDKCLRPSHA